MLGNAVTFKVFSKITAIGRVVKVFLIKGNVGGIPRTSSYDTTQLSQLGNDGGSCGGWSISSTDRQTGAGKQTGPDIARQAPPYHNIVRDDIAEQNRAHTIQNGFKINSIADSISEAILIDFGKHWILDEHACLFPEYYMGKSGQMMEHACGLTFPKKVVFPFLLSKVLLY